MTVQALSKRLLVAAMLSMLCVAPRLAAAQTPAGAASASAQPSTDFPDSPGSVRYPSRGDIAQATEPSQPVNQAPAAQAPAAQNPATQDSATQGSATQGSATQGSATQDPASPAPVSTQPATQAPPSAQTAPPQRDVQKPAGTAASPIEKSTGIAASNPAGVAIAPAKQKRSRSILIKVGALVGAGAALGTVMALSQASPSKPPGAH
jgi:hypothetical protein